jgi:hypothetical protein
MRRLGTLSAFVLVLAACSAHPVHHSIVPVAEVAYPPYRGPVVVSITREPAEGIPVAIVQVYGGQASIERLVPEMSRVAARLGADLVKIDRVKTRFDQHDESTSKSYECGTEKEPKTCTDTRTETIHDATTQILGRAFRKAP